VLARIRLVMSAGAPVPAVLLESLQEALPKADFHTPYGMTEALPVTDVSLEEIRAAGSGDGVCVGSPLPGVDVAVSRLSPLGEADGPLTTDMGVTGEICVRAPHVKDRYDALWVTERRSGRNAGWHRTGDVGHLDDAGRLWVEGRLPHVITTSDGPLTPVGVEQRVEHLDSVKAAAVVGVGPAGTQAVVAVVVAGDDAAPPPRRRRLGRSRRSRLSLAPTWLTEEVRAAAAVDVAAVLTTAALPVDIRHASKVDRAKVADQASRLLAGSRRS
jgi:olefin beta-lactone synthetase